MPDHIGVTLRDLREAAGKRAIDVARAMGVTKSRIWKIECDDGRKRTVAEVAAYLAAIDASPVQQLEVLDLARRLAAAA